jgi:hypothetical protein
MFGTIHLVTRCKHVEILWMMLTGFRAVRCAMGRGAGVCEKRGGCESN